jgi:hypothetical protein
MKRRYAVSLLFAMLALVPSLVSADDTRWDVLRVYKLADGKGVAVAFPGEWQEVSKTRVLEADAPARFIDQYGRRVEIPAAILQLAAEAKAVARPEENRRLALRSR